MNNTLRNRRRSLGAIFVEGDIFTKLSYVIWGLSNIVRGQIVKGCVYLGIEVAFFYYLFNSGIMNIANMITLGTNEQGMYYDESIGIYVVQQGDNSMLMLLYGVVALTVIAMALVVWVTSIRSGELARLRKVNGQKVYGVADDVVSLFDQNLVRLFLFLPLIGILIFTVVPLIYMILMAFTNYDSDHQPPGHLFNWVGLTNFKAILNTGSKLGSTFLPILGWTLIWAVVACFSCSSTPRG